MHRVVGFLVGRFRIDVRKSSAAELGSAGFELLDIIVVTEPTGSYDSITFRWDVEKNPPDEFRQRKLHQLKLLSFAADAKGYGFPVESMEPLILDRAATDVASQVGGDTLSMLASLSNFDDPLLATRLVDSLR